MLFALLYIVHTSYVWHDLESNNEFPRLFCLFSDQIELLFHPNIMPISMAIGLCLWVWLCLLPMIFHLTENYMEMCLFTLLSAFEYIYV